MHLTAQCQSQVVLLIQDSCVSLSGTAVVFFCFSALFSLFFGAFFWTFVFVCLFSSKAATQY